MGNCEMCGKEAPLFHSEVEGCTMKVCKGCGKYGKNTKPTFRPRPKFKPRNSPRPSAEPETKTEKVTAVVTDYSKIIQRARAKTGKTQKEFARHVNFKESIIHKIETGSFELPLDMAKKLEKSLNVALIETREEKVEVQKPQNQKDSKKSGMGLTIGDLINVR